MRLQKYEEIANRSCDSSQDIKQASAADFEGGESAVIRKERRGEEER